MDAAARQLLLAATRRRAISGATDRGGGPAVWAPRRVGRGDRGPSPFDGW